MGAVRIGESWNHKNIRLMNDVAREMAEDRGFVIVDWHRILLGLENRAHEGGCHWKFSETKPLLNLEFHILAGEIAAQVKAVDKIRS